MFCIRITIRCYFASLSIDICVLHSIFFEIFVSENIYFIYQIVMVQSVRHSLSLRNNLHVPPREANNGRRPLSEAICL